jgi:hypothetical protein
MYVCLIIFLWSSSKGLTKKAHKSNAEVHYMEEEAIQSNQFGVGMYVHHLCIGIIIKIEILDLHVILL